MPLVTYLGAIAQFLLPGVRFFDGVPISQLLVANSTNAMGIVEPNALYGVSHLLSRARLQPGCGPAGAEASHSSPQHALCDLLSALCMKSKLSLVQGTGALAGALPLSSEHGFSPLNTADPLASAKHNRASWTAAQYC